MSSFDLIVIGGGAAGLSAAVCAAEKGDSVLILEAGPALGRKILASGNGRCNLMNLQSPRYYGNNEFAEKVIKEIPPAVQRQFWQHAGLIVREEKDGRVYPCTFQSASVLLALKNALTRLGVKTILQAPVKELIRETDSFMIRTDSETFCAKRVVIATGGPAHTSLGGNDSGLIILKPFGIRSVPFRPALTPLITDRRAISGLSGIRVRCTVRLFSAAHELLHCEEGEVLFTDYGVSGICAMQCARFCEEGCVLELDLAERLFPDQESLLRELYDRRERFSSLPAENLLNGILVPKLSFAVLKQAGFSLRGETTGSTDDRAVAAAAESLRHYRIGIKGTRGLEDAQVSAGGIECTELDPHTMSFRTIPGLHAAGEILNADGDCGGFNLMFAFATGILSGLNGREPAFLTGGCRE